MSVHAKVLVAVVLSCGKCGRTLESAEHLKVERGPSGAFEIEPAAALAKQSVGNAAAAVAVQASQRGWTDECCGRCRDPVAAHEVEGLGRDPRGHGGDHECA